MIIRFMTKKKNFFQKTDGSFSLYELSKSGLILVFNAVLYDYMLYNLC